jgi:hypothetical protein
MATTVNFQRLVWEDYPSTDTPLSADNLNRLEEGVDGLYNDVEVLNSNVEVLNSNVEVLNSNIEGINSNIEGINSNIEGINSNIEGSVLYFPNVVVSPGTGDIAVISNSSITPDHVLAECAWADQTAIKNDVSWTSASGTFTLNGVCISATSANITLIKKMN